MVEQSHTAIIKVQLCKDRALPSLDEMAREITLSSCGAIGAFSGITRDNFNGKKVKTLYYEGYESMAVKELQKLAEKAVKDYQLHAISICHRLGEVVSRDVLQLLVQKISEASVNIVTLSPHRKEALLAAAWAIDELKMKVPIWKKEYYEDGTVGEQQCCSGQEGHGGSHKDKHETAQSEAQWKGNPEFIQLREQVKDY